MNQIVETLLEERKSLIKTDIQAHLDFLEKSGKILHHNHYVLTMTQRWILPLSSHEQWNEKDLILKRYLKLLKQLKLGVCKDKARILFEIANISLSAVQQEFYNGKLEEPEYKEKIAMELIPIFDEVKWILRYDSKTSFEGKICSAVEFYITSLKNFVGTNGSENK